MRRSLTALVLSALLLPICSNLPAAADAHTICDGAPNSVGAGASLRWAGTFQPDQGELRVEGLPANVMGMMLYSDAPQGIPFGNGMLCVGEPQWILARARSDAAGTMQLDIASEGETEDTRWMTFAWQVYGINTWYFQYWYRDTAAGGAMHNLSDAIRVSFE